MLYFGRKFKKLFVYSQASEIKTSDFPTRRFPSIAFKIPPTVMVGSFFAMSKIWEIMEVVVVFPWVPDTAMEF